MSEYTQMGNLTSANIVKNVFASHHIASYMSEFTLGLNLTIASIVTGALGGYHRVRHMNEITHEDPHTTFFCTPHDASVVKDARV